MKKISVITPCYNEEENVGELVAAVRQVFAGLPNYTFEHIFIDNDSNDGTVAVLREITRTNPHVRVIVNSRNFGHIRSPYHGLLQATGDAALLMAADFQDPPSVIPELLAKWEEGYKMAIAIKDKSEESAAMFAVRRAYYRLVSHLSEIELIQNFTGFGVYDRVVIETLRKVDDPYPYFRGLISDIGFEKARVKFTQPTRKRGITKNNFYTLYDIAMLGITNHSKVPLRIATMAGFLMSGLSLFIALGYFAAKLIFWSKFELGTAPILIGLFFFSSVQLFFIGIIGEYVGSIQTQVMKRPVVIEKERINWEGPFQGAPPAAPSAPVDAGIRSSGETEKSGTLPTPGPTVQNPDPPVP
jgi:glycosyltransferase involved in cell wall biosynthesis